MGRKRISHGKARRPISISLPREMVILLDRVLPLDHSRSRLIERLLNQYLNQNTTLRDFDIDNDGFERHCYYCKGCDFHWHINKYVEPQFYVCRSPQRCSETPHYIGILGAGEEE